MVDQAVPPAEQRFFIGRQPILDREQKLIAFELLFRAADVAAANVTDYSQASASVIISSITHFGLQEVLGRYQGFFNVSYDLLMDDALELLPRDQVVIELLEVIAINDEVVARCHELKEKGFSLALDDHVYAPVFEPLYEIVDVIKIDVLQTPTEQLAAEVARFKGRGLRLLAEKVENQEMFRLCYDLGFEMFQGYYFARPVVLNKKRVDVSGLSMVRLLNQVMGEAEVAEIEETFRQNPSMAYNLLRLVNSVAMGLRERIKSLRHAIVVLGRQQLLRWAQLALFAAKGGQEVQSPLLEIAALRGRLMELLVKRHPVYSTFKEFSDRAFMTGVLSLLDALFETTMDQVVAELNLTDDIRLALLEHEGDLGLLLRLVECLEQNDFESVIMMLQQLKLDQSVLLSSHLEAIQWTNNLSEIE
jgi:c-di-GMP-related signal transduction protein